jgi:leucyl aminopeptidase
VADAARRCLDRLIDSPIADMKNVGPREGGSITAAQFISASSMTASNGRISTSPAWPGPTRPDHLRQGRDRLGVRLLDQFVADNLEG